HIELFDHVEVPLDELDADGGETGTVIDVFGFGGGACARSSEHGDDDAGGESLSQ
ncbi:MAG: hypothetical protein HKN01_04640, partial [Acidimicrobiia bacterium]|nr:hypothetical protein [Acidimicrobiia bacterium]